MPQIVRDIPALKVPQLRVLAVLAGDGGATPFLTRAKITELVGYTPASGTVTRVLNGLRDGSSSGAAHLGLVALGLVEKVELEIEEGVREVGYQITNAGRAALASSGSVLPPKRSEVKSINHRYRYKD